MPFDSTPQVTPALALLRAARAKIEDPRNWVKHAPWIWEQKAGLHCVVSAVASGLGYSKHVGDALGALRESLPLGRWGHNVGQFSDAPEVTHADIMMLFDRAERRQTETGDD